MNPDLEKTIAGLVKVARQNEQLLSVADRETIFAGATLLETFGSPSSEGRREPSASATLSGSLTAIAGELRAWADRAKQIETQVAELRWVAVTYRNSSDEQWGVLEEAKRLDLDISKLPRFESALFRALAARLAVRRVKL